MSRIPPWPGNVREVKGVIQYAAIITDRATTDIQDRPTMTPRVSLPARRGPQGPGADRVNHLSEREALVVDSLCRCDGNQNRAAALLGVTRTIVWNRMCKYGMDVGRIPALR